jgi:hypothetical protein
MTASLIAYNVGILSIIIGFLMSYIGALLIAKYRQKRQKATLYLMISTFAWALCSWTASVIYLTAGDNVDTAKTVQIFMYGLVFTATIFTYMFARKIFFVVKTQWYKLYVLVGIIAIIIIGLSDSSDTINFPDSTNYPAINLKTEYSLILVAYILPTLIGIMVVALKTAKKMEEKGYLLGFRLIGFSQFFIFLVFVCDAIASANITDPVLYAFFLYMQWIVALVASICSYVGWALPPWFKRIYKITD